jgi:hypothetical protein
MGDDAPTPTVSLRARLLRRNWWLPVAGVAAGLVGLAMERFSEREWVSMPIGFVLGLMGLTFAVVTLLRGSYPRSEQVQLTLTPEALAIPGRADIRPDEVVESKIVPRPGRDAEVVVTLTLRGGEVVSLWMLEADATSMLAQLGLAAGERRASFALALPLRHRLAAAGLAMFLPWVCWVVASTPWTAVLTISSQILGAALYSLLAAWLLSVVRGRVVVGADGFTTRWLGRERFHAFDDVAEVTEESAFLGKQTVDTQVRLRSGRRLRLRAVEAPDDDAQRGAAGRAVAAHLRQAHQRFEARAAGAKELGAALARGGRPERDWLAHLASLVRGGPERYRVASIDAERLAELAADPQSAPDARLGAAAALVRLDPDQRPRVRIAAEACAEPGLKDALLAMCEAEDDAALEAALGRGRRLRRG